MVVFKTIGYFKIKKLIKKVLDQDFLPKIETRNMMRLIAKYVYSNSGM